MICILQYKQDILSTPCNAYRAVLAGHNRYTAYIAYTWNDIDVTALLRCCESPMCTASLLPPIDNPLSNTGMQLQVGRLMPQCTKILII